MGDVALKDWLFQRLEEAIEIIRAQDLVLEQHGIEMVGGHIAEQRTALLEHLEWRPYFAEMSSCLRKGVAGEVSHDLP
jgi:hypothetical protein